MLVKPRALVPQIVGTDDRRVASGVAEADRAFFEDGDVADTVLLGEIIGRRQAVATAADDDDIVARLWRRLAPQRRPAAMPVERLAGERGEGIMLHRGSATRRHLEVEQPRGIAAEDRPPLGIVEERRGLDKPDGVDLAHICLLYTS